MFRKKDKSDSPFCSCVLVAAGTSSRMGGDKMTIKIAGRTVLERSIAALEGSGYIDEVVVVTQSGKIPLVASMARDFGFSTVKCGVGGGASRNGSAYNGVCGW